MLIKENQSMRELNVALSTVSFVVMLATASLARAEAVTRAVLSPGTPFETTCFTKRGDEPGPTIVVIGGMHGDEEAGYLAARELVHWRIRRGTLIVVPDGNPPAIRRRVRQWQGNLNRSFPGKVKAAPNSLARAAHELWKVVADNRPALLLTLHESRDFHINNPARYGQTFTYDFKELQPLFDTALKRANASIPIQKHRFLHLVRPFVNCPTYQAWKRLHVPATSIETSRTLSLTTRLRYQKLAMRGVFDAFGLGYEEPKAASISGMGR
jgi:hypothetical protein